MDNKIKAPGKTVRGSHESRNTSLLRIGVLFLSLVSFFTTANGMRSYIFTGENGGIAFAASAAIQSILLALSMNLPKYLQGIWNSGREDNSENQTVSKDNSIVNSIFGFLKRLARSLWKLFLCGIAVALTIVTILCSSWFSYVYIADVIHTTSWGTDSELLVQQTYRKELYDARDYAHAYRTYLEERVGEDILTLEKQAQAIADPNSSVDVNWDEETASYLSGDGSAAGYMAPVITAMRSAMAEGASQESRDLAATAISDARGNIEARIEIVQTNLDRINANLENYNRQMSGLTSRINAATDETDVTSLNDSINRLTALISSQTQRQIELQQENTELDRALLRLPLYESILGLNSSTSSIAIRTQLIEMQSEFFKPDPDDQALAEMATNIFDSLRSAATAPADGEAGQGQNSFSYTNLLVQMNRLIRNLADYSGIKTTEANLDELITALRDTLEVSQDEAEIPNTEGTGGQGSLDTEDNPDEETNSNWKKAWQPRLEALKAQISSMPAYSEEPTAANTQGSDSPTETDTGDSDKVNVLTNSQQQVLRDYDRNAASAALDEMIRRYISDHNAVYQGLIYLASPYRMLAIFALCLALSFDLSGFVFGIVMQGDVQRDENEDDPKDARSRFVSAISGHRGESSEAEWSILGHLHQYRVLTGDFSHREDTYYYQVFRDGLAEQWPVKETNSPVPYKQGIYLLERAAGAEQGGEESERGILVPGAGQETHMPQEVLYSGQGGGPQDGVFEDCLLIYEDGGLYRKGPSEMKSFICSLEEYVPVHCYDPEKKENRTFPVKQLESNEKLAAKIAVVALSEKGTRVSAIYVIRDCRQDYKFV